MDHCPSCGSEIQWEPRFCPNCGVSLTEQPSRQEETPTLGAPLACPSCGNEIQGEPRFCPNCGVDLTGQPSRLRGQSTRRALPTLSGPLKWGLLVLFAGVVVGLIALFVYWTLDGDNGGSQASPPPISGAGLSITSPAFDHGDPIPVRYTCDGEDVSPRLEWENVPDGTKSIALIVDDPDAPGGTFVHWVVYDLPAGSDRLVAMMSDTSLEALGGTSGGNDFGKTGYGGPCPPPGEQHRYFFKLYALDTMLDLVDSATKSELLQAMNGHVLAQGELMGTYQHEDDSSSSQATPTSELSSVTGLLAGAIFEASGDLSDGLSFESTLSGLSQQGNQLQGEFEVKVILPDNHVSGYFSGSSTTDFQVTLDDACPCDIEINISGGGLTGTINAARTVIEGTLEYKHRFVDAKIDFSVAFEEHVTYRRE